jgi:tetratricopeptide (TPR) repeat protein/DNA-binding beta-propeller fold protein YncE
VTSALCTTASHATIKFSRAIAADTSEQAKFSEIAGMFMDAGGTLFLTDSRAGRLIKLDASSDTSIVLGGKDATFRSTRLGGLTGVDSSLIAVVNTVDATVAVIDASGRLQYSFAEAGSTPGRLSAPTDIAYSSRGRFYVADGGNNRISVYSRDGVFLFSFGSNDPAVKLNRPTHIAVDTDENVYVLDSAPNGRVSVYSHSGKLLKRIGPKDLRLDVPKPPRLAAMAVSHGGEVFVADGENGKIMQIDRDSGEIVNAFGGKGKGRGQFHTISGLAVTPSNQLIVGDSGNDKIEIYDLPSVTGQARGKDLRLPGIRLGDSLSAECSVAYSIPDGQHLCLNVEKSSVTLLSADGKVARMLPGKFKKPTLAAVDDKDVIIVDGSELKVFSHQGEPRFSFGRSGSKDGQFKNITGIYLRDKIYVADSGKRVQIFSRDGVFLDKLANRKGETQRLRRPGAVVVDAKGNIYVADNQSPRIRVFSREKELMYELNGGEDSSNRYRRIRAMTLDQDDNLYVLASTSNPQTVHVYNGKTLVFTFGSAMQQAIGLGDATSLMVPASKKTRINVYDKKRQTLQVFDYLQVPELVEDLLVTGGLSDTELKWRSSAASFVDHYAIYAATTKDGPYIELGKIEDSSATITHDDVSRYVHYRVAAVSGFGVEGPASETGSDLFQTGYGLYGDEKYAEAAEIFLSLYNDNSEHGEVLEYLGLSLDRQGKHKQAIRRFQELAKIPAFELKGLNRQAESFFGAQQFIETKAVADKAIARDQADASTYLWCGKAGLKLEDTAGAVNCLEKSIELDPNLESAHFLLGHTYVQLGAVDKGLAQFDQAVKVVPDNITVWIESGRAHQALAKHVQALERFNKALAIDKLNGDARLGAARSYIELNEYKRARAIALSMSGVREQEAAGQYLLGVIALANNRPQEAVLSLTKAVDEEPKNTNAWIGLADAYLALQDQVKARSALRQAISAEPALFEARLRLALLEQQGQNHVAAAREFEKAVVVQPNHYNLRYRYAISLAKLELLKEAAEQAEHAAILKPHSSEPLVLLASISHQQGKNGDAIRYLKKALARDPTSTDIELELGRLYLENDVLDISERHLQKAALKEPTNSIPHSLLGQLFLKKHNYDQAIAEFTIAVELDDNKENRLQLNTAYAEKKKSLEFDQNAPLVVLRDLQFKQAFSSAYKRYTNAPVGSIKVVNTGEAEYKNLRLTFHIKDYMDFPTHRRIDVLGPNETTEMPLLASFNNKIRDIDEDTGVQVEVKLDFYHEGQRHFVDVTQPMTIYGKNAIVWREADMVGSFVTPTDEILKDYVRQAINSYRPEKGPLDENMVSAMTWFNVLSAYGMKYVVDPSSPFPQLTKDQLDYVQFPRETLKVKSGDCDDLSVLLSAGLENLGIETAMVDVPGHLFLMFNTRLPDKEKHIISLQDDLMVVRDGEVWIPLEATMISTTFSEAWAEGARKYQKWIQQEQLQVIPLKGAWRKYVPVTLAPAKYSITPPVGNEIKALVERERTVLVSKSLDRFLVAYRSLLRNKPDDIDARMQIGIIYGSNGLHDLSLKEFDQVLQVSPQNSAAYNNRGNLYYIKGDYDRALEAYREAEALDPKDGGIKVNLALVYYKLGSLKEAVAKHGEAVALDENIGKKYEAFGKLLAN